jgi:uncharacterized coiled-coil protein SlyX
LFVLEGTKVDPEPGHPRSRGQAVHGPLRANQRDVTQRAFQEHRKIEELEATVAEQRKSFESALAKQHKQIEALTLGFEKVSAQIDVRTSAQQVAAKNP